MDTSYILHIVIYYFNYTIYIYIFLTWNSYNIALFNIPKWLKSRAFLQELLALKVKPTFNDPKDASAFFHSIASDPVLKNPPGSSRGGQDDVKVPLCFDDFDVDKSTIFWRICWTYSIYILVGGFKHGFYFSIYWECHDPNWRTPSFFRGAAQPPTRMCLGIEKRWIWKGSSLTVIVGVETRDYSSNGWELKRRQKRAKIGWEWLGRCFFSVEPVVSPWNCLEVVRGMAISMSKLGELRMMELAGYVPMFREQKNQLDPSIPFKI